MSLLYKEKRTYTVDFMYDGEHIIIDVNGNIGKFGVDEPLFSWEGTVEEFVDMLSENNNKQD